MFLQKKNIHIFVFTNKSLITHFYCYHIMRFTMAVLTLAVCTLIVCTTSCMKSTDSASIIPPSITKSGNITTVKNLDATSEERFSFFSLREGAVVVAADSASDKWDIGVRKTSIIVNGGSIRAGKGAGLRLTSQAFESLRVIPASNFRTDDSEDNLAFTPRTGQSWYSYDATVINPIKDVTLLIRTGNGQMVAKLQIQSYYKDAVAPDPLAATRFYTFRYQLSNSTTQTFE